MLVVLKYAAEKGFFLKCASGFIYWIWSAEYFVCLYTYIYECKKTYANVEKKHTYKICCVIKRVTKWLPSVWSFMLPWISLSICIGHLVTFLTSSRVNEEDVRSGEMHCSVGLLAVSLNEVLLSTSIFKRILQVITWIMFSRICVCQLMNCNIRKTCITENKLGWHNGWWIHWSK